jgi:hypothetical protein
MGLFAALMQEDADSLPSKPSNIPKWMTAVTGRHSLPQVPDVQSNKAWKWSPTHHTE